ncbi:DUF3224 domain-containing protein [Thalassomonas viridans]|uniref:DUF3224 domain-containing protein n=1 Tax=Thalassomonas viridans TaxID=137584 RepID=UPI001F2D27EC|nr:DUF3224 domain-containing protein [Thalassomonas viridans]
MRKFSSSVLSIILIVFSFSTCAAEPKQKEKSITATGSFDIKLEPQKDSDAPAGRMIIRKTYNGDLAGTAIGQMLSKRTKGGAAAYSAVEEVSATLAGKTGSFTLIHYGFMSQQERKLEVYVLPGSGTGELSNISGTLDIIQAGGKHEYVFKYAL